MSPYSILSKSLLGHKSVLARAWVYPYIKTRNPIQSGRNGKIKTPCSTGKRPEIGENPYAHMRRADSTHLSIILHKQGSSTHSQTTMQYHSNGPKLPYSLNRSSAATGMPLGFKHQKKSPVVLWALLQFVPPQPTPFWSYLTYYVASLRAEPVGCVLYNM